MAPYHPSTSSPYFTRLLVMEKCKAVTTKGVPCTANAVNDGYCIVHFKRHAKAISPPAFLSPRTPRSTIDTHLNKPLPTLPPSSSDGSPSSLHRKRRIKRSPTGDHNVQSPVRHKLKIKTPNPSKPKECDTSPYHRGRDDIYVDTDSSDSEEIFVQLEMDEKFGPSIPHTDSTYGSDDSIISLSCSSSSTNSNIDDDSEWKPYYMGARWRVIPSGVIVVGDKDGDRIRQRILGKTRKRFAKEKYDKVHNNVERGNRREGDKDQNPSPVRWPFSSPTTGTFDEDSQQSNEEGEGHIKTENKEKRPLLHRRGIISEINIAIDSIAEFADSDEDTVASPFPITIPTPATSTFSTDKPPTYPPATKTKANPTDSRHHLPTPTSTHRPRFQPLRAPPRPPAGGSATATGISTTTSSHTMASPAPHTSSSSRRPHLPHSAPTTAAEKAQRRRCDPGRQQRRDENERQPLATVWELDRVCETLTALRLQHAASENLALDAFYREALVQVWRILDTHVEMAKERMEGRGRREEGGEGEGDGE